MNNKKNKPIKELKWLLKNIDLTIAKLIKGLRSKELEIVSVQSAEQEGTAVVPITNYASEQNRNNSSLPSEIAIIARSEMDFISRCILDYPNIETGGQLFGYWSADGTPVVLYAIGPGLNANHQATFFNQDTSYLVRVGEVLYSKYGLHHIGEWHSHHQLGLAQPSGHDANTMITSINNSHLGRFLLCIGNCTKTQSTLNAFNFVEGDNRYVHSKWHVQEFNGIDYRKIIDTNEKNLIIQPVTKHPCHGNLYLVNDTVNKAETVVTYQKGYWYNSPENKKVFARIVNAFNNMGNCKCTPGLDKNHYVYLNVEYNRRRDFIYFPKEFPKQSPLLVRTDRRGEREIDGKWVFNGDIYDAFVKFYNSIKE